MLRSEIRGVGSYLPDRVITNHDLEKMMDTSDEWIIQRSGIKERRWVVPGEDCTSSMAYQASLEAIEMAGIEKEEIDLIIFATLSPDHDFPGSGCFLQERLSLAEIPALDIRQQCTGFIYGLDLADIYIRGGRYKNVLVVGSEVHSKGLDLTTSGRDVAVLFGDGAGACIVSATEVPDDELENASMIWSSELHAEGKHARELWCEGPGSNFDEPKRLSIAMLENGAHFPFMNGKKVYIHATRRMCEVLLSVLQKNQVALEDVDLFLFHQANLRINETIAQQLKIPAEKVFNTIQSYGNTTAATIPIGMNDAVKAGKLQKKMLVATVAFGAGFTWGANLLRF